MLLAGSVAGASPAASQRAMVHESCAQLTSLSLVDQDLYLVLQPIGHPMAFGLAGTQTVLERLASQLGVGNAELSLISGMEHAWEPTSNGFVPAVESEVGFILHRDGRATALRVEERGRLPMVANRVLEAVRSAADTGDLLVGPWAVREDSVRVRLLLTLNVNRSGSKRVLGTIAAPIARRGEEARLVGGTYFTAQLVEHSGTVVTFVIGRNGRVEPSTIRVIGAPTASLERSITRVVKDWRYQPASLGHCRIRERFSFGLGSV